MSKFVIFINSSPKNFVSFKSSISYLEIISAIISEFCSFEESEKFKFLIIKIRTIIIIIISNIPPKI